MATLFRSKDGATAAYCPWGRGGVVVLASGWSISNEGIGKGDNFILILNALNHRDLHHKPVVTFDEYHHGYGATPGIGSLIGIPARLGLAQLLMAFVLLVFAISRRFGRPIPLIEGGRQRNEYLSSMSSLLRKAGTTGFVGAELRRELIRDIGKAVGLSGELDEDKVLRAVEVRRPDKVSDLRKLLSDWPSSPQTAISEARLLALEARWHQIRKELMGRR